MAASKTRLTKYIDRDGAAIYAAKITAITPFSQPGAPLGSMTLMFGELDKKSHLIGSWVAEQNPQVGGYFVCYDTPDGKTMCRHETASSIAQNYTVAA